MDYSYGGLMPIDLLFVDRSLGVDPIGLRGGAGNGLQVVWLDPGANLLSQIGTTLAGFENGSVGDLGILTHGAPGALQLGGSLFGVEALRDQADVITGWSRSLSQESDILIYGCSVGAGAEGSAFLQELAFLASVDVAGSDDASGRTELGGDFDLEICTGTVETALDLSQLEFNGLLAASVAISGTEATIFGTVGDDLLILRDNGLSDSILEFSSDGTTWNQLDLLVTGRETEATSDDNYITSLVINTAAGDDTIVVEGFASEEASSLTVFRLNTGTGRNTLVAPDSTNIWTFSDSGTGTLNSDQLPLALSFTGIEAIVGGIGDDTLTYANSAAAVAVNLATESATHIGRFEGIEIIRGSNSYDTLIGPDAIEVEWIVSEANAGTVQGVTFESFEFLRGQDSSSDLFQFGSNGSLSGNIEGAGGEDVLDFSASASAVELNLEEGSATAISGGFKSIESLIGSSGNDTLIGPGGPSVTWTVDAADAGTVGGVNFASFELLQGGKDSDDLFVLAAGGSISGQVDGGSGGNDGLAIVQASSGVLTALRPNGADDAATVTLWSGTADAKTITYMGLDAINPLDDSDPSNVIITGSIVADTITITQASADWLRISVQGTPIYDVATGAETSIATYNVELTALTRLTINTLAGDDTIAISAFSTTSSGFAWVLDAGEGDDTLSTDNGNNTWTIDANGEGHLNSSQWDLASGSSGFGLAFTGVNILRGGSNQDTIIGPDDVTDWYLDGGVDGRVSSQGFADLIRFSGMEMLQGGSNDDYFVVTTDEVPTLTIQGGAGTGKDSLLGATTDNTWELTSVGGGTLNDMSFTGIESLLGNTGSDTFNVKPGGSISGLLQGGGEADDGDAGTDLVSSIDTIDYSAISTAVLVDLAAATATHLGGFEAVDKFIGSGSLDTITGPNGASVVWTVSGPDAGSVEGVAFESFEFLQGQNDNTDLFLFEPTGRISGDVRGGLGGSDGLAVQSESGSTITTTYFNPSQDSETGEGNDRAGVTPSALRSISYSGLDRFTLLDQTDPLNLIITGTAHNDSIRIAKGTGAEERDLKIRFEGSLIYDARTGSSSDSITIGAPQIAGLESLRIDAVGGADRITVESLPIGFESSGVALSIYGNRLQRDNQTYPLVPEDDGYVDAVTVAGSISLGYLEVFADHFTVDSGTKTTALTIKAPEGIFVRNRNIGIAPLENLSPLRHAGRQVSATIGSYVELDAGDIYFVTQAEDRSLGDVLGTASEVSNFVIGPLTDALAETVALPVKLLLKQSTATISIGEGSKILSSGTVGIYATAVADASGIARGSLVSFGYTEAKANATVTIAKGVEIDAAAAVVITSTGDSTASISASTERKLPNSPDPDRAPFSAAVGIAYGDVTSTVTVAQGASITAGKTANVNAVGGVNTEASGEAGLYAGGKAGLGFGIEVSKANIHTTVNGAITSRMENGSVVKLEIDPTVSKATYRSDETNGVHLKAGDTVELLQDVMNPHAPTQVLYRKGTVLSYLGTGTGNSEYANTSLWQEGTPNFGYVDYDRNQIFLGDTSLVTEDTVIYTSRRGENIGNLVSGREYFVIQDTDNEGYYWLAETEALAVRAGLGYIENNVVDLTSGSLTKNNARGFSDDNVDAAANTISLPWEGGVFNTFELGQAVIYRQGSGAAIDGLVDGNTYYVAVSTNQTNLQGNSRFVDQQVIGLSESENEARAGVLIDIGNASGSGYTLLAKHVLDSGFATGIGIVASLSAENNANASAGITSDDAPVGYIGKFKKKVSDVTTIPNLFDKILRKFYPDVQGPRNAPTSNPLSVAGSLAFTLADHTVLTDVGSSAVLKSNEDLEIKATIEHKYTLGAESDVDPTNAEASSGTDNAISVAANIGVINNTARATVHGSDSMGKGAEIDALRATRLISDVSYPFLTRADEYIPLSLSEFTDSLREEGSEAITKYLNGTLGAQDAFFNTWVTSSAEGDKIGVSGSVNAMVMTNVSEAIAEGGVQINQDLDWRNAAALTSNDSPANLVPGSAVQLLEDVTDRADPSKVVFTAGTVLRYLGAGQTGDAASGIDLSNAGQDYANADLWEAVNPHPNQAAFRQDSNRGDGRGEQVVSIEATNYQQTINMTGIFSLPELSLDIVDNDPSDAKANKRRSRYKLKKELSIDPFNTEGGKAGAGGSVFVNVLNNTTRAIVEGEAANGEPLARPTSIYSGGDGGFNMKAEEALFNIHLAQSFGKGGRFGVAGGIIYAGQDSTTLVRLDEDVRVTGREARLYAGNLNTTATWTGGVAAGKTLGVGFAIAINDIDRAAEALIGDERVTDANTVSTPS